MSTKSDWNSQPFIVRVYVQGHNVLISDPMDAPTSEVVAQEIAEACTTLSNRYVVLPPSTNWHMDYPFQFLYSPRVSSMSVLMIDRIPYVFTVPDGGDDYYD